MPRVTHVRQWSPKKGSARRVRQSSSAERLTLRAREYRDARVTGGTPARCAQIDAELSPKRECWVHRGPTRLPERH